MNTVMDSDIVRKKVLKAAVGIVCCENGFSTAENSVLETLTEMLQSCKH